MLSVKLALLATVICSISGIAQTVYVDGSPLHRVDGSNKTPIGTTAGHDIDGMKFSPDGNALYAHHESAQRILVINPTTGAVADSLQLNQNIWDFIDGGDNASLLVSYNPSTYIYKYSLSTKQKTDSVSSPGGSYVKRPGASAIWFADANDIKTMTPPSLALTSLALGLPGSHSVRNLSFTDDGATAYFFSGAPNQPGFVYKMNAATQTITDTLFTPQPWGNSKEIAVSNDGSTLYMAFWGLWPNEPSKIYFANTSTMTVTDSVELSGKPFGIKEHPTKSELWVVYHYTHKIMVLDKANSYAPLDSVAVGSSPKMLLFGEDATAIHEVASSSQLLVYPNPANDEILVDVSMHDNSTTISLTNMVGTTCLQASAFNQPSVRLDVSSLASGIYMLAVSNNRGSKTGFQKVVIR